MNFAANEENCWFNITTQLNSENPGFVIKSEARNPKSETMFNVKNTNFQNRSFLLGRSHPQATLEAATRSWDMQDFLEWKKQNRVDWKKGIWR